MEWDDSYSVGVADLDDDHKKLISIINRVQEMKDSGKSMLWALEELEHYAQHHFSSEEAYLADVDYAELVEHKEEHQAFHDWLKSVRISLSSDPEAGFYLAERINDYLQKWLVNHILETDMKYKGQIS